LDDINATFVYGLICDSVVGDSRVSRYSFNNLKWFKSIWPLDELYRVSNVNGLIIYNTEGIVTISFLLSKGVIV